ncbi:DUF924 family protein [Mesorhizobium sp. M2D.F.Ca.ET.185.01.1.1]|uniref:DUF924 family protein n=1 Tax=unclassified Mesorhizobium TaxID=325217 RepID=UPI000FCB9232|nr:MULTISPECIES: DUF924 family protein [unclassified Mesorhizobium]TGP80834.1 DUF924 family protein [bacterium M00.F.Ca.ET.227.01.1.1]TGP90617.1 DUF924 family protein [bacterium M00.F.Ca.ET.221.01.1.1]TGP97296.1 DUF924 family protein [bacterium M00.F.Ca.ET.222.01.1.1]TGU07786.1 DUF924 family protein [bacterium M00.F.Ca.ET.163.01.1.1]TGU26167.1 DUF924 family protein [bacterium M00.F.Ca.ET.156.01.1.1]TGU46990.1 DUF924 family protein [bacterium M00.F.Ca.ET.146.01.1.1]TGV70029.1 DUF924 family pr
MAELDPRALSVTKFWRDAGEDAWFEKSDAFDTDFRNRFLELHYAAARRECDDWNAHAEGSLALMILLDQFPRNCFRGTGHMYATDPLARHFADKAIAAGHDLNLEEALRVFLYLPFEHSEALADQKRSVQLTTANAPEYLKYAEEHLEIIRRFGRFPHRNRMLGRATTADEQAFLDSGGFSG